jgi:hypothetical protein
MTLSDAALLLAAVMERFAERRSWNQADLSARLGLKANLPDLLEILADQGWPLHLEDRTWSIPEGWASASLRLSPLELAEFLRLLVRSPRSKPRDRILAKLTRRMRQEAWVAPLGVDPRDEHRLALERAAREHKVVEILYYSREACAAEARLVSVQDTPPPGRDECWGIRHPYNAPTRVILDSVLDLRERPDRPYVRAPAAPEDPPPSAQVRAAFEVPLAKTRQLLSALPAGLGVRREGKALRIEGLVTTLTPAAQLILALGAGIVIESPELRGLVDTLARIAMGELGLEPKRS